MVNLRPADDEDAYHVEVDLARVAGVLRRIAYDIDELARARAVADLDQAAIISDRRAEAGGRALEHLSGQVKRERPGNERASRGCAGRCPIRSPRMAGRAAGRLPAPGRRPGSRYGRWRARRRHSERFGTESGVTRVPLVSEPSISFSGAGEDDSGCGEGWVIVTADRRADLMPEKRT
ncbi:hypothetical protein AB0B45_04250 [Nonomuraea sp. NPDC049152]|uniref:hypothetical protein n=1 Tax=Nonomuraea sp. NPDC049152 TaxID=3154350 RepID=UPI0033E9EC3F